MYSYPNYIPLPASEVERIGMVLAGLTFNRIYGAWWNKVVESDAGAVVRRSIERYQAALEGRPLSGKGPGAALSGHTQRMEVP
jgi:hypothetical protein